MVLAELCPTCRLPAKCRTDWFGVSLLWSSKAPFCAISASCGHRGSWLLPYGFRSYLHSSWLGLQRWTRIVCLFLQHQPQWSTLHCNAADSVPISGTGLNIQIWTFHHYLRHSASVANRRAARFGHHLISLHWPTCIRLGAHMVASIHRPLFWFRLVNPLYLNPLVRSILELAELTRNRARRTEGSLF